MTGGLDAGIYSAKLDFQKPYKHGWSIFQSKVFSVGLAAEITRKAGNHINIHIYNYSQ